LKFTGMSNLGQYWLTGINPLIYLLPETFKLFDFPIFLHNIVTDNLNNDY